MTDQSLIHGSAVVLGTNGVFLLGKSGSGKSTLALSLISECKKHGGFAQLVGDDQLSCLHYDGAVIVEAAPTISGKIEQAFNGIVERPHIPSVRVDLIVRLKDVADLERMPNFDTEPKFPRLEVIDVPERQITVSVPLIFSRLGLD